GERTERGGEIDTTEDLASDTGTDLSQRNRWDSGAHWASRFKQASAAKRRATGGGLGKRAIKQSDARRTRVTEQDRQSARELDPTAYLGANGYDVKHEGRHRSVRLHGDEVYRVTQRQDGHWVWCDLYGNNGGDNIDLVREIEPGTGFAEAVFRLAGAPTVGPKRRPPAEPKRPPPRLPKQEVASRALGRDYLINDRGISMDTIEHAEQCGMLRYANGGVLFVGYDQASTPQNITRRAIESADPMQKRDLRGSDKRYPPILPGDPSTVWIVEGGSDALALHDIAKRQGRPQPTVIVSGGANVRSFLEQVEVQAILKQAERVTIAGENERDEATQKRTDEAHQKQVQRVKEITGRAVKSWTPKQYLGKDLAEMNYRQQPELMPVQLINLDQRAETKPSQVIEGDLILGQ
ncbi:MAG TPA: relaxase, partial [Halothiobacillus sp.]|nr:relaxase [Halothiobacillus sp.]